MIHIPNINRDPARNLAMEEYILTSSGIADPVLFFYINAPSIIIGRHQNTLDEINADYVRDHGIQVVRRCSGGGAVYHDPGNLNYSLIRPGNRRASADFSILLGPILEALRGLGLDAKLSGRNDITLNGAKFSGNAYYHNRFGSVIHGTLLYDSDLEVLSKALIPHPEKIRSKGIPSVRSRVCCIREALHGIDSIEMLEEAIIRYFAASSPLEFRHFSRDDLARIEELTDRRYRNDEWTYGESPSYSFRRHFHQPGGWVDFRADIRGGTVHSVRFFGDFFANGEISELEASLAGTRWEPVALRDSLDAAGWKAYFPDYAAEDFIRELFSGTADA